MKELGITKERVFYKNGVIKTENINLLSVYQTIRNPEEAEFNKNLVLDSFKTCQKTNLLPSELLERYNEAIEVLKWFTDFPEEDLKEWIKEGKPVTITVPSRAFELAEQIISKAKT